ncbi:hypothetical protein [Amycolatopsis jejuensis]|uniref:hypothetical protein n=1 Tax=Amycolatopsis jejuensis TaxID=330084 RepID=UPI00068B4863|nr:hypothetical protein [Amycolatopsis jejuensis]
MASLQWIGLCLGIGFGVGGLVGAVAGKVPSGTTSVDLGAGLLMTFVAGLSGSLLYRRLVKRRGQRVAFAEVFPRFGKRSARAQAALLWVLLVFCVLMVVSGVFAPLGTSTATNGSALSALSVTVALLIMFSLGATACVIALVRMHQRRALVM